MEKWCCRKKNSRPTTSIVIVVIENANMQKKTSRTETETTYAGERKTARKKRQLKLELTTET